MLTEYKEKLKIHHGLALQQLVARIPLVTMMKQFPVERNTPIPLERTEQLERAIYTVNIAVLEFLQLPFRKTGRTSGCGYAGHPYQCRQGMSELRQGG